MSLIELICMSLLIIIFVAVILALIPIPVNNNYKKQRKELMDRLNNKHLEILTKISIYEEDRELDRMLKQMPWLEQDVREYRELREQITGIKSRSVYAKSREQTDESTDEGTRDEDAR